MRRSKIHRPSIKLSVHHVLPATSRSIFISPSTTTSIRKHKQRTWWGLATWLQRCDSIRSTLRSISAATSHQQSRRFGCADNAERLLNTNYNGLRRLLLSTPAVVSIRVFILWSRAIQQPRSGRAANPEPFCAFGRRPTGSVWETV